MGILCSVKRHIAQPQGVVDSDAIFAWTPYYQAIWSGAVTDTGFLGATLQSGVVGYIGNSESSNYIEVEPQNSLSPTEPQTYLIVVKSNGDSSSHYPRIFGCVNNATGSSLTNVWGFLVTPANLVYFTYLAGDTGYAATATRAIINTAFETLIVTVSGAEIKLYLNGILNATAATAAGLATGNSTWPVRIGHQPDAAGGASGYPCSVALAAVLPGIQYDIPSLTSNPWQIFKSPRQMIYFPTGDSYLSGYWGINALFWRGILP